MKKYLVGGRLIFEENALAQANKSALLEWKAHATRNNYKLAIMLIPDKDNWGRINLFSEFKSFLQANEIERLDLQEVSRAHPRKDMYWADVGHFSPYGNRVAAEELIKRWAGVQQ